MKFKKEAISVYNPQDPFEKSIQDSFHRYNVGWLTSFECRLATKAISSLKYNSTWINEENLFPVRSNYFFDPQMIGEGAEWVFPTNLLFLRDILENGHISSIVHNPIVFVSKPIAYFLFREWPIHIIVRSSVFRSGNCIKVGGIRIFVDNIKLEPRSIVGFKVHEEKDEIKREIKRLIAEIITPYCGINKAAVSLIDNGVFKLDTGIEPELRADDRVQHKYSKKYGKVYSIDPGDNGYIIILYDNGEKQTVNKTEFYLNFLEI
ncbi:MAG: hypothetical protein WC755_01895 [Candidatus Woesearchaeota archaeon]|jgi:hypothetical protein